MAGEACNPQSNWRNIVILEVSDGRIVSVEWTAAPRTGGPDKLTHSINGDYGMERVAEWPWHKQADAISGATIGIPIFVDVGSKAIAEAEA